jgi:mRNA-degrading endonuclease toxin of MazEF toxin-antitoxin module
LPSGGSPKPGKGRRTPSTTTYRRGRVVVVKVPFTGEPALKPRPALVVSTEAFHGSVRDVIVCPISSQPRYFQRPGPGDRPLKAWRSVGLRYPSTVRVSNILALEKRIIKRVLGTVTTEDLSRVEEKLAQALGLKTVTTS